MSDETSAERLITPGASGRPTTLAAGITEDVIRERARDLVKRFGASTLQNATRVPRSTWISVAATGRVHYGSLLAVAHAIEHLTLKPGAGAPPRTREAAPGALK